MFIKYEANSNQLLKYERHHSFSVVRMAKVLAVSESGYYKWLNRPKETASSKTFRGRVKASYAASFLRTTSRSLHAKRMEKKLKVRSRAVSSIVLV